MRVPWNEDEAIIIVDAFYQYKNGIIKKNDAIKSVSARLREMAIKKGLEIDDVYRNENGITMQMAILEHIFSNGEKGLRSGSKLFRDTMQLYVDNYAEFELKKERIKSEPMKERFSNFIRSHFAYGIRIDSPIEVMRLRKFYSEDFGEECQMTDEEIKKMLFDSCFIHDGKGFIIASETEERIRTEIDELHRQGNEIIYYDELYAKNEEWFYGLGIFSSEMLKSYLGKKFKAINCKKSFFAWEALTENELLKNNITSLWGENVLRDYYGLKNDMEYVPIDKIKYALANNTCFVWNSAETYTIEHKFVISEDEKNTILEYVANNINVKGNVAFDDMPLESVFEENYELSDNAIFALVYNLVLSSKYGTIYQRDTVSDLLINDGVKKNDATSIINAFKRFCELPLGTVLNWGAVYENGRQIDSLYRNKCAIVDNRVILYSLLLFVENCDENKEFTLSWLMDELVDRNGVSPSKVFGLDYEEMKSALMGLSQKYPDFIIASFTNDLDKISILQKKSEDVISLFEEEM